MAVNNRPLRIAIVAGEISGDILGAGFIKAVQAVHPDAEFVGIAGPRMQALGCKSLFDMEELAVMGLVEVLSHLPRLLSIKRELVNYFSQNTPNIFVGIDAPDFNLRLERSLKDKGIKTVQYVSPSVWAWRQNRIYSIIKATDLVLALLPFEKAFYDKFNHPCTLVGHTMADDIPLEVNMQAARKRLNLSDDEQYLAVLPGSRRNELNLLAPIFIQVCQKVAIKFPSIKFIVAMVNEDRKQQFIATWQAQAPELDFILVEDTARDVIAASNAALLASGTVALECMLLKRPMVVGYKVNAFTGLIAKLMLKTPFVALPNILAGREIVAERIQSLCTPEILFTEVCKMLEQNNDELIEEFTRLHKLIRLNADQSAAHAVLELIGH